MFTFAAAGMVLPLGARAEHPPTAFMFTNRVANSSLRMPQAGPDSAADFPQTLADTGAFADLSTLAPHPGVTPFEVNVPLWSDGAQKTRWSCLPGTNRIEFRRDGGWEVPIGTVWIKHFDLELTNGVAESARRLETRFLVKTEDGVYGVTYRWGGSLTNAMLVGAEGLDETFQIHDGSAVREQTWHYPARSECVVCHNQAAGYALGFNTAQFNREVQCPDGPENQIRRLSDLGYFHTNISGINTMRALAHPTNGAVSLEHRVRSYLAVNCLHCHQPGAIYPTPWNAVLTSSLPDMHLIDGTLWESLGDPENRVIKPGDPDEDGACNYLEFLTGTNPQRSDDAWRISIRKANGAMQVSFPRIANRGFELQRTTNLADPLSWEPLDVLSNRPFFPAVDGEAGVVDTLSGSPQENAPHRFYRVRVFEP